MNKAKVQITQTIGKILKQEREKQGFGIRKLAIKANIEPATISTAESGKTTPSITTLIKLAKALNITLDELCGLKQQENTNKGNIKND